MEESSRGEEKKSFCRWRNNNIYWKPFNQVQLVSLFLTSVK